MIDLTSWSGRLTLRSAAGSTGTWTPPDASITQCRARRAGRGDCARSDSRRQVGQHAEHRLDPPRVGDADLGSFRLGPHHRGHGVDGEVGKVARRDDHRLRVPERVQRRDHSADRAVARLPVGDLAPPELARATGHRRRRRPARSPPLRGRRATRSAIGTPSISISALSAPIRRLDPPQSTAPATSLRSPATHAGAERRSASSVRASGRAG